MNNKTILIILAVVIVLGAILFFAFGNNDQEMASISDPQNNSASTSQQVADYIAQQNAQNQNNGTNTNNNTATTNSVSLIENPSGNFVTVAQANLTKPGYVVFHRVNSNGESAIIGQTELLNAGAHSNIKVQVDTTLAEKQAVVAVLHEDDGDGEFEYPDSDGYLVNNGQFVSAIDVIGITRNDAESKVLEAQVSAYIENNFEVGTSTN